MTSFFDNTPKTTDQAVKDGMLELSVRSLKEPALNLALAQTLSMRDGESVMVESLEYMGNHLWHGVNNILNGVWCDVNGAYKAQISTEDGIEEFIGDSMAEAVARAIIFDCVGETIALPEDVVAMLEDRFIDETADDDIGERFRFKP